ncbi:unnamed protein product [Cuscuta epithymum]|uniref:Uncharacterized protein n=1 Tax=Cuscuta epithymum TaxID=186058 RepID=A0AAV0GHZ0_9ASTE|nr:unnamed protein product [Cuscuta epithymum]CAH9147179.1 unnamed protein product [Cuscuta epithymum]
MPSPISYLAISAVVDSNTLCLQIRRLEGVLRFRRSNLAAILTYERQREVDFGVTDRARGREATDLIVQVFVLLSLICILRIDVWQRESMTGSLINKEQDEEEDAVLLVRPPPEPPPWSAEKSRVTGSGCYLVFSFWKTKERFYFFVVLVEYFVYFQLVIFLHCNL